MCDCVYVSRKLALLPSASQDLEPKASDVCKTTRSGGRPEAFKFFDHQQMSVDFDTSVQMLVGVISGLLSDLRFPPIGDVIG